MMRCIPVTNGQCAGGAFSWLHPFAILTGIGLVLGYARRRGDPRLLAKPRAKRWGTASFAKGVGQTLISRREPACNPARCTKYPRELFLSTARAAIVVGGVLLLGDPSGRSTKVTDPPSESADQVRRSPCTTAVATMKHLPALASRRA